MLLADTNIVDKTVLRFDAELQEYDVWPLAGFENRVYLSINFVEVINGRDNGNDPYINLFIEPIDWVDPHE